MTVEGNGYEPDNWMGNRWDSDPVGSRLRMLAGTDSANRETSMSDPFSTGVSGFPDAEEELDRLYMLSTDRCGPFWHTWGMVYVTLRDVIALETKLPRFGDWYGLVYLRGGHIVRVVKDKEFVALQEMFFFRHLRAARSTER